MGSDLASTIVEDGEVQEFLNLYAAMAVFVPTSGARDGDVIEYMGEDYMVLELIPEEQARLSDARVKFVGSPGENMMVCERVSAILRRGLLTVDELEYRKERHFVIPDETTQCPARDEI